MKWREEIVHLKVHHDTTSVTPWGPVMWLHENQSCDSMRISHVTPWSVMWFHEDQSCDWLTSGGQRGGAYRRYWPRWACRRRCIWSWVQTWAGSACSRRRRGSRCCRTPGRTRWSPPGPRWCPSWSWCPWWSEDNQLQHKKHGLLYNQRSRPLVVRRENAALTHEA